MPKLNMLSFINVRVDAWPKDLSGLGALKGVHLWRCPLTTFPAALLSAPALEDVTIGGALFKTIPTKKIASHKALKTIRLGYNERLSDERIEALRQAAPHLDVQG